MFCTGLSWSLPVEMKILGLDMSIHSSSLPWLLARHCSTFWGHWAYALGCDFATCRSSHVFLSFLLYIPSLPLAGDHSFVMGSVCFDILFCLFSLCSLFLSPSTMSANQNGLLVNFSAFTCLPLIMPFPPMWGKCQCIACACMMHCHVEKDSKCLGVHFVTAQV